MYSLPYNKLISSVCNSNNLKIISYFVTRRVVLMIINDSVVFTLAINLPTILIQQLCQTDYLQPVLKKMWIPVRKAHEAKWWLAFFVPRQVCYVTLRSMCRRRCPLLDLRTNTGRTRGELIVPFTRVFVMHPCLDLP